MKVSLDDKTWTEPRFLRLCQALGCGRTTGVGTLVILWHSTRERDFVSGTRAQLLHCLPWPAQPGFLDALIACGYVALHDDGAVEVEGNAQASQLRAVRVASGRKSRDVQAAASAKRKLQNEQRRKRRQAEVFAKKQEAEVKAAKRKNAKLVLPPAAAEARRLAWEAYSAEYQVRWGVVPVRNARTNALIAQFVQRVGRDLAPQVLKFFVRHNDSQYLRATHGLNLAVRDAEGLATQFHIDQPITSRDIAHYEEAQAPRDQLARIQRGEL